MDSENMEIINNIKNINNIETELIELNKQNIEHTDKYKKMLEEIIVSYYELCNEMFIKK
jgi:hypothetical protein